MLLHFQEMPQDASKLVPRLVFHTCALLQAASFVYSPTSMLQSLQQLSSIGSSISQIQAGLYHGSCVLSFTCGSAKRLLHNTSQIYLIEADCSRGAAGQLWYSLHSFVSSMGLMCFSSKRIMRSSMSLIFLRLTLESRYFLRFTLGIVYMIVRLHGHCLRRRLTFSLDCLRF